MFRLVNFCHGVHPVNKIRNRGSVPQGNVSGPSYSEGRGEHKEKGGKRDSKYIVTHSHIFFWPLVSSARTSRARVRGLNPALRYPGTQRFAIRWQYVVVSSEFGDWHETGRRSLHPLGIHGPALPRPDQLISFYFCHPDSWGPWNVLTLPAGPNYERGLLPGTSDVVQRISSSPQHRVKIPR